MAPTPSVQPLTARTLRPADLGVKWCPRPAQSNNGAAACRSAYQSTRPPGFRCVRRRTRCAPSTSWGARLVASSDYAVQKTLAGRLVVTDLQVANLLDRLLGAQHRRLSAQQCAVVLAVAPARLSGAVEQVRKLVNVEGYPVISRDPATGAVILDLDLAVEQFGVSP
jgi:hypothetical protein